MANVTPVKLAFKLFNPVGGADDKPPIIFLHGITASKDNWGDIPQTAANATKRKAYAMDARNHGDSEWSDYWTFDCNVDDLFHFMDSVAIPKAIIVGHSMGGIVAIKTALRNPDRVEKLVVEDIYTRRISQAQCDLAVANFRLADEALKNVPLGSDEETAQKFIADYMYKKIPQELLPKVAKRNWTEIKLKRTGSGRYSYTYNAEVLEKALMDIVKVQAENKGVFEGPALFIYGSLSPNSIGKEKDDIRQFFPNAEFVEIVGAAHTIHRDFPTEYTEALLKFLSK